MDLNEDPRPNEKWFEDLLEFRKTVPLSDEAADLAIAAIREHREAPPRALLLDRDD